MLESVVKRSVLYRQVAEQLVDDIQSGTWIVGDNLPSETQLAINFQVSRQTIRQALQCMQENGFIHRQQGAATKVISTSQPRKFSQSFNSLGEILNYPRNTYRENHIEEYVECDSHLQKILTAPLGSAWYHIGAVRLEQETNIKLAWTDIYILQKFAKLTQMKEHSREMVYAQIEKHFGVSIAHADVEISASQLSKKHAELLGVPQGTPSLIVLRRYFDQAGNPFEISMTHHPENRYTFKMNLRSSLH
jgi:DNA-binding GntR family transcriptional regulator